MGKSKITYSQVGDDYSTKDPVKKLAQSAAALTGKYLKNGFEEVADTRGESAYVWKQGDYYMASVVEGLGTKNLVADELRDGYNVIGHDTVATIINDLVTVGAKPLVIHAYWAIEDNSWLQDGERMRDLIGGWKSACDLAGVSWGGGETPTLKGIIIPGTVDLGGSAVGIISSEKRLITDKKLTSGDRIILLRSNGINTNGISLARVLMHKLPERGKEILTKTNIYAKLVQDLLDESLDIHYISNITGHGLRKIMRSSRNFTYVIEKLFEPQEVFKSIQEAAGIDDLEMYQTFNMGQDYVIFLPAGDAQKAQQIISQNGFESLDGGFVEDGERKVIIKPKNIVFEGSTLDLR
ncbi:phosphoribosylformylglycinamidine cyclo-ligase [Candidatus Daviesbacteria bacterium]|nr:phosphoribosylformylglycinamidine cyclo-ligase [Candidatus Daviesbacteria bacterium]